MTAHSLASVQSLPAEPSAALTAVPKKIGRFTVRGEIGRGSNGVVYSAHDPILAREVAIKAIPLSQNTVFRSQTEANFLNEAKAAAGLSHKHIVTVFDAGKSDHFAYIAMERLRGEDLHDFIARGTRMDWRKAATLMARVADAVHYAHIHGLVHRDLKPSNIFLLRDGKPKVLDFGVALMNAEADTGTHKKQLIGTPNYMSPEQARGERLDARSDVFSIGSILYELLAGIRAFEGKSIDETLMQVLSRNPTPITTLNPDVSPQLVVAVAKAMEKDPAKRFQSAGEFRNALVACIGRSIGSPSTVRKTSSHAVASNILIQTMDRAFGRLSTGIKLGIIGFSSVLLMAAVLMFMDAGPTDDLPPPDLITDVPRQQYDLSALPLPEPDPDFQGAQLDPAEALGTNAQAKPQTRATTAQNEKSPNASRGNIKAPSKGFANGSGTVSLAVTPWGEVWINGVSRGVSPPLRQLSLPEGVHTVEIRNSAAPPYVARIEVKPDKTLVLQHRF